MQGQQVCRMHGGSAGQSRKAGARRRAEAAAEKAVATLGLAVDVSPTEALLEEVRWTAGHVQWLRARVQELGELEQVDEDAAAALLRRNPRHPLVWGTAKVVDKQSGQEPGVDTTEAPGPSVWYELYARERNHLVTVCTAALKAGVEERRVRLAESQGELVAGAIRAILAELGLNAKQQALVAEVVPRQLRLLAGGAG